MGQVSAPGRWRRIQGLMLSTALIAVGCGLYMESLNFARLRKTHLAMVNDLAAQVAGFRTKALRARNEVDDLRRRIDQLETNFHSIGFHILQFRDDVATWAEKNEIDVDFSFSFPDNLIPKLNFVEGLLKAPLEKLSKKAIFRIEGLDRRWAGIVTMYVSCAIVRDHLQNDSAHLKQEQTSIKNEIENYNMMAVQEGLQKFVWKDPPRAPDVPVFIDKLPSVKVRVKPRK